MKVGIDTFGCDGGRSGLGSYLMSLVPNLPEDPDIEYELFGPEVDRYTYSGDRGFSYKSVNVPDSLNIERLWHVCCSNSLAKKNDYDVVLFAAATKLLPLRFKKKNVAVVNEILSSSLDDKPGSKYSRVIKRALSRADCIIASSDFIRNDLLDSGIKCSRIEVVHNGVDHSMFYPHEGIVSDVVDIKPFAIKRPYIMYPSRMHNRLKKHIELIQAFTVFKEKTGLPHRLVIAGNEGAYSDEVRDVAHRSSAASDIFFTGYFPHENFPELYRNAEACIVPSINEGAGLPVMEAMASGLPVACSSLGALNEIAGDAAYYFDSSDIGQMAEVLEKILCDSDLRKSFIAKGLERSKMYSWENSAKQIAGILQSVCKS